MTWWGLATVSFVFLWIWCSQSYITFGILPEKNRHVTKRGHDKVPNTRNKISFCFIITWSGPGLPHSQCQCLTFCVLLRPFICNKQNCRGRAGGQAADASTSTRVRHPSGSHPPAMCLYSEACFFYWQTTIIVQARCLASVIRCELHSRFASYYIIWNMACLGTQTCWLHYPVCLVKLPLRIRNRFFSRGG